MLFQAKHIPYRDSKLTRILQESLGGNSRTTLIINCSPSAYNEAETLSTLRFGIRAKSIKNTARVNQELSPLELKGLLSKAQLANTRHLAYIQALEAELAIWRSGGSVEQREWATPDKPISPVGVSKKPTSSPTPSTARSMTPVNPVLEGLRSDIDSRPQTPTVIGMDKDEREEFLRRENELSDQLAEKESALASAEKLVKELREELAFLREQEASVSKVTSDLLLNSYSTAVVVGEQSNIHPIERAPFATRAPRLRQQRKYHHNRHSERAEPRFQERIG